MSWWQIPQHTFTGLVLALTGQSSFSGASGPAEVGGPNVVAS